MLAHRIQLLHHLKLKLALLTYEKNHDLIIFNKLEQLIVSKKKIKCFGIERCKIKFKDFVFRRPLDQAYHRVIGHEDRSSQSCFGQGQ